MTTIMFLFALFMLSTVLWKHRKKITKRLPKRKDKPLPAPQKSLYEVHKADHEWWMGEALAILQTKCDHLYHHQAWYTCKMCGYEEPWEHADGCACHYVIEQTLTDAYPSYVLIQRESWCTVHGTDFRLWPISDRKRGPYGTSSSAKGTDGVRHSQELTRGRSLRPLLEIEGSH